MADNPLYHTFWSYKDGAGGTLVTSSFITKTELDQNFSVVTESELKELILRIENIGYYFKDSDFSVLYRIP